MPEPRRTDIRRRLWAALAARSERDRGELERLIAHAAEETSSFDGRRLTRYEGREGDDHCRVVSLA